MLRQKLLRWMALILLISGWLFPAAGPARAQDEAPPVVLVRLEGPLNPIWQEMLKRALRTAELRGAGALVIELNTPGGSVDTMVDLVQQLRASPLPVMVYVSPDGAMAASAGTLITLAGHAAAMAPETAIGAASPVGSQGEDIAETEASQGQRGDESHGALAGTDGAARKPCAWRRRPSTTPRAVSARKRCRPGWWISSPAT